MARQNKGLEELWLRFVLSLGNVTLNEAGNLLADAALKNKTLRLGNRSEAMAAARVVWEKIHNDTGLLALRGYFSALKGLDKEVFGKLMPPYGPGHISKTLQSLYTPLWAASGEMKPFSEPTGSAVRVSSLVNYYVPKRPVQGVKLNRDGSYGCPLLLVGAPGAGKTTLLRHIALNAFHNPGAVGLPYPHLPLLLRCKALTKNDSRTVASRLWHAMMETGDTLLPPGTPEPDSDFLTDWPRQMDAPWLLLCDSWHELANAYERESVSSLLKGILNLHTWFQNGLQVLASGEVVTPISEPALILTTRPTETIPSSLADFFVCQQILPLGKRGNAVLTRHWLQDDNKEIEAFWDWHLPHAEISTIDPMGGTPLWRTLSLLLWKITLARSGAVSRTTNDSEKKPDTEPGKIGSRLDLYQEIIETLFNEAGFRTAHTRSEEEYKAYDEYGLYAEFEEVLLRIVAFHMTKMGHDPCPLTKLEPVVETAVTAWMRTTQNTRSQNHRKVDARRLIEVLCERSGVLIYQPSSQTGRPSDTCTWIHSTFREYLTARYLAEGALPWKGHGLPKPLDIDSRRAWTTAMGRQEGDAWTGSLFLFLEMWPPGETRDRLRARISESDSTN